MILVTIISGIAAGLIAATLSSSAIFDGLREAVYNKSERLGDLVSCPYCLSFYLAALFDIVLRSNLAADLPVVYAYGVSYLFMTFVAIVAAGIAIRLHAE